MCLRLVRPPAGLLVAVVCLPLAVAACSGSGGTPTAPTEAPGTPQPASPSPPSSPSRPAEWDPATQGIPRFVSHQYLDLDAIGRISRFRSGEGHSYTDDVEQCRSMKHYFDPRSPGQPSSIRVYSPVEGVVADVQPESAGVQIRITPAAYPAFRIILFHVNAILPLEAGARLMAGQSVGTHIGSQTMSDVAVGVATPTGYQLISWFDVLDETTFDAYRSRGIAARSDAIISRAERDSQLLTCSGEQFANKGSIGNWVNLR